MVNFLDSIVSLNEVVLVDKIEDEDFYVDKDIVEEVLKVEILIEVIDEQDFIIMLDIFINVEEQLFIELKRRGESLFEFNIF